MLFRDEAGHVVAVNVAHRSRAEVVWDPLSLAPDRQGR